MKNKYRIVKTHYDYLKYAVQTKYWWFPFCWWGFSVSSMSSTVEECEKWIDSRRNNVVVKVVE